MITKLDENNFDENVKTGLKVVEFLAPWCGYCKKQNVVLEELDKIWIGQVNGDEAPRLVQRFNIKGFPSFVVFKEGKDVVHFSGLRSKFELMNILLKYMK